MTKVYCSIDWCRSHYPEPTPNRHTGTCAEEEIAIEAVFRKAGNQTPVCASYEEKGSK